ncbi:DnaA/Hda family protein [Candidatus Pelagibacter sp.]|nr:DnaA/Hda family protein [Candidatus Pelagibacter sp.]MDC3163629.1 DnaA/Hda family protein [Candidatus Pelagibacter sp.]
MSELDQKLLDFGISESFDENDYYVSKSNYFAKNIIETWPQWEKKIVNLTGERYSGKTHLSTIFKIKSNALFLRSKNIENSTLKNIKLSNSIIIEDLDDKFDETLLYSIFNLVEQDNKYLLISSNKPINTLNFSLPDLVSRLKNCIIANIEQPDDDLIYAIILKSFSDRQIKLDNKIVDYIIKRIARSYSKMHEFIYKIDELSLKKRKSINFKIIKEIIN